MNMPVGIPKEYYPMIRDLPKENQVRWCSNENEALLYMKYYNQNVLLHLLRKKGPLSQNFNC